MADWSAISHEKKPGQSNGSNKKFIQKESKLTKISFLSQSLVFLEQAIKARLSHHFGEVDSFVFPHFEFESDETTLSKFIVENQVSIEEFLILMLAITPHVHSDLFGSMIKPYFPKGGDFPEFGGIKGINYRGIIPTGETLLFLLAGTDIGHRIKIMNWLQSSELSIFKKGIVTLEPSPRNEPEMCGLLLLSQEYVSLFIKGQKWRPVFSTSFPASPIETTLLWNDLVLPQATMRDLAIVQNWLIHQDALRNDENLGARLKPGFRALFHGNPGTGKTLTATLLGKLCKKDVFRVDLSMVVSKYIGETEKNLQIVFDTAENKDWILFFDEADALFGKRTNVQSSHDKYANQEVSYLLQKVEEHHGLVILASNFLNNIDSSFMRRFQAIIHFPIPNQDERLQLWKKTIPTSIPVEQNIDLVDLSKRFELSGSSILNIVQKASIRALSEHRPIQHLDLLEGVRDEYAKVGKSI